MATLYRFRQVRGYMRKATVGDDEKTAGVACHEEKKEAAKRRGECRIDDTDHASTVDGNGFHK